MDKPIILAIEETEKKIRQVINQAGIPAFFIHYILDRIEKEIIPIEENEIQTLNQKYAKEQEEKKGEKK